MTETVRFSVTFRGAAPEQLKVGDELRVSGIATVRAIKGDLVDITSLGCDTKFVLGDVSVDLFSNAFQIAVVS